MATGVGPWGSGKTILLLAGWVVGVCGYWACAALGAVSAAWAGSTPKHSNIPTEPAISGAIGRRGREVARRGGKKQAWVMALRFSNSYSLGGSRGRHWCAACWQGGRVPVRLAQQGR
ncbi:hypothetical protein Abor_001_089 [Acetobacter orientalis]|uniref:Uncharacterized protein n=1 Tax=Acetobacter orientalis TaxID=146474 RepID=A0A2Z5ZJL1_9PROT|nr:hypothetical protein Abor_001_089 [Acetobacter orientalis]